MSGFSLKPTGDSKRELKNPDTVVILDLDWVKYSSASAGEKRTISVTHNKSGKKKDFANRTEFCGRSKKVLGGWIGEENAKREEKGLKPFTLEDFTIEDVQTPEPVENILHTAKLQVEGILDTVGTNKAEYFIGEGDSWRVEASTLLCYKGQRADLTKPIHLDAVSEYLINKYEPTICRGLEADDWVVIRYKQLQAQGIPAVVAALDKDTYGCNVHVINPNRRDEGIVDCSGFGELYISGSGSNEKIRGHGLKFLAYQTISQDTIDNYKFNCFSDKRWGEKSAYKALVDCKDEKELFSTMIEVAKQLYPEPKEVDGWRGDTILIDARYVLNEMFVMARMLETEQDFKTFDVVAAKYGVSW